MKAARTLSSILLASSSAGVALASHLYGDPSWNPELLTRSNNGSSTGLSNPDGNQTVSVPVANGGKAWGAAFKKAKAAVDQMTLQEKVNIVTGQIGRCAGNTAAVERLGIRGLCLQDGPAGVRPAQGQSQFPPGITTAATFDRDLWQQRGAAMGYEFYHLGVNVALSPVTGGPQGRSPLEGRSFESFGTDTYLTGEAAYATVTGMQSSGVGTCAKHWIGYEQETWRNLYGATASYSIYPASTQLPIDSYVDDRATHEVYMPGFVEAIRAGTTYVMCSYNELNGTHSCANAHSLSGLIKTELNFQGAIISDWGAVWSNQGYIERGLDLIAPGLGYGCGLGCFGDAALAALVNNGTVPESRITDATIRNLMPYYVLGQDVEPLPSVPFNAVNVTPNLPNGTVYYRNVQTKNTVQLIKTIGIEGAVLLKNEGGLPLKNPQVIALIGADAGPNESGPQACGAFGDGCNFDNNNGTMSTGGGSGYAFPHNLIDPLSAIQARAADEGALVQWVLNNTDIAEAQAIAQTSDAVLVFCNAYADEGQDRENLDLNDNCDTLVNAVANVSNITAVILHIPGAVDITSFVGRPEVKAILAPLLPGEQTGNSLVPLLWGDVSPSGKLPFTLAPLSSFEPGTIVQGTSLTPKSYFNESLHIDYKWLDAYNKTPTYEYGYGLSYSSFSYSNIKLSKTFQADSTSLQTTNEKFEGQTSKTSLYDVIATVTAQIKNTGSMAAKEAAQLYVSFPEQEGEPINQLRGFSKVSINPGSTATVSFNLRRKDLMIWDVVAQQWRSPKGGSTTIKVGASSRKLYLSTSY